MKDEDYVCKILIWIQETFSDVYYLNITFTVACRRRRRIFREKIKKHLITIAAILSVLLLFASCGEKGGDTYTETNVETEDVSAEDSETNTPETEINLDEIILPSEDDFSNPDFVIEKGVLMQYLGCNAVVTVPDTVAEIAEYAFSYSPSPEKITEIRLGKNVGKISPKAFFELDALVKIESVENPFFVTKFQRYDNAYALYSKDQPVMFYFPDKELNSITYVIETEYYHQDEKIILAASNALFEIDFEYNEHHGHRYWGLYSVSYGETVKNFKQEDFSGNIGIYAFETDEAFVFMKKSYNMSDAYFFVNDSILEEKSLDYSVEYPISFYSDDGELKYIKMASGYSILTSGTNVMGMCLYYTESRDEFCAEYGRVEITDEELIYIPEKTYNISEYLEMRGTSIDECFEKSCFSEEYDSLDELLTVNAKRAAEEKDN